MTGSSTRLGCARRSGSSRCRIPGHLVSHNMRRPPACWLGVSPGLWGLLGGKPGEDLSTVGRGRLVSGRLRRTGAPIESNRAPASHGPTTRARNASAFAWPEASALRQLAMIEKGRASDSCACKVI